jgi:hypothetical protein
MATPAEITRLRILIEQPHNVEPYTDIKLSEIIDTSGTVNRAASDIAYAAAQRYAKLTDISEGGSSRKNSQLHANFLAIAKYHRDQDAAEASTSGGRSASVPIRRA